MQIIHVFVKARNNFESTRAEVERLMKRIRSAEEDFKAPSCFTMEGYLYIQEKREKHKTWTFFLSLVLRRYQTRIQTETTLKFSCMKMCFIYYIGPLGSVWTRYYCTYEKSSKIFTMSNTEVRPASRQVRKPYYVFAHVCPLTYQT